MPNWVTTRINAPKHVIQAMLNNKGEVDFSVILPFPGPRNGWDGISCAAEEAAEIVCRIPVHENPLIASLQTASRLDFDIKKLSDQCFAQFVGTLENYRACGYLHSMEFARAAWGTKWNACDQSASPDEGKASFDTAWSCPDGVLTALSRKFPEDAIDVVFADEDIGSNCGRFTLKNGVAISKDIAPAWRNQTAEEKEKWQSFAYEVKGWEPDPDLSDSQ